MRAMKDSGVEWIGEIPQDWEVTKISTVYQERNTKVSDKEYTPLSVTKFGIVPQLETAAKTDNGDNRKLIKKNDFVINSRSDRRGSCGISEYDGSCSLINIVLEPRQDMCNKYYNFVFKSELFSDEFYRWGNGIVDDLWSTKWSNMKNIYIPFPHLERQQHIANYLNSRCSKIDSIIGKQQAVIEKLKEYKLSVITEVVTKGLNPDVEMKDSGVEWLGEVPKHWEVKKLRYVGLCQNGISKSGEFFGTGYPFVSYSDVYKNIELPKVVSGKLESTEKERELYSVVIGDIFFTRTSETIEEIGFSSVCLSTIADATFAGFLIRVRPFKGIINPNYAKYYFRSQKHREFFVKEMNLVTRASLSQELLKRLPVLIPNLSEQEVISNYLDGICEQIERRIVNKLKMINKLLEYKKSLIYEVVTGKKEV